MSTIKTINIQHPSSANINIVLTSAGASTIGGNPIISLASGTAMIFNQTSAPTGWTKSTTHNNKALRIVSGSVSSGGTVAFTTAFASQSVAGTVGNTTLSTSQIPSHNHSVPVNGTGAAAAQATGSGTGTITSGSTGGGGSHNHSFTGTAIDLAVQYVDVIIATVD